MTSLWDYVRVAAIIGPIVMMMMLGLGLTIQSGVVRMASAEGVKRSLENASRTLLMLAGSLIGLAVIHHAVGLRVGLVW